MSLINRFADAGDASAIAALISATWPDDTADEARIARILRDNPRHATLLTFDELRLVGFVSGFLTTSKAGCARWEVDLLAVDADYRGQGIACRLVTASADEGRRRGAVIARGLVRADNTLAARTFAGAEFVPHDAVRTLMICSEPLNDKANVDDEAFILPVDTFNYVGLWLEDAYSADAFYQARLRLSLTVVDLVGAVAPNSAVTVAQDCGFTVVGDYRWWQRDLTADAAPAQS